ncbi:MAG: hypothetical protein LLG04_13860 [Parachlamydia sp.]|nr:hypothetical protein [Parachlamydia sp.]
MDYDASKIHGRSEYFDASKLSEKPQLGKYHAKLLDQKTLSRAEEKELGQILRSATKTGSAHLVANQLIQHYLAELHGPNASTQAKMTSAAGKFLPIQKRSRRNFNQKQSRHP